MITADELNWAIYRKYYDMAKQRGVCWTLTEWAIKQGLFTRADIEEDDHAYCAWESNFEHAQAVKTVLNYEIAFFVFRRLSGTWGEVTDFFVGQRNKLINQYREQTGYEIISNAMDTLI